MERTRRLIFAFALGLAACSGDASEVDSPDATSTDDAGTDAADPSDADTVDAGEVLPPTTAETVLEWVDPFIGSGGVGFAYGGLSPAAQAPVGMVRVGPDSSYQAQHGVSFTRFSGYQAGDPTVRGFSHLHFVGTGVADYGNLRFLPTSRAAVTKPYAQWFSTFEEESSSPGRYAAELTEGEVGVEIVAGVRAAIHRYTFGDPEEPNIVVLDPTSSLNDEGVQAAEWSIDGTEFTARLTYRGPYVGRRNAFELWMAVDLGTAPEAVEAWDDATETWGESTGDSATRTAALVTFSEDDVELRVGLSFQSLEQARANRDAETEAGAEALLDTTESAWREYLSRVLIEGGTAEERTRFYTALYNTFRMPTRFDEAGRYRGLDGELHDLPDGQERYFTDLSLWDTYRTLHPLWTLIAPELQRDALASLVRMSEDGGWVPRWPAALSYTGGMEGEPAAILFGDSAARGLTGVDYRAAYDALSAVADTSPPEGSTYGARGGIERYIELGWIPADEFGSSASNTLEWAIADHALGALAEAVGESADATRYRERGRSWRNLWNEEEGFFLPRNADGTWAEFGSKTAYNERGGIFVEGSAWHYRFYAMHDPEGLVDLMGEATLERELETFFAESNLWEGDRRILALPNGYYWHSNQPSIHTVTFFAALDRLDRLGWWARQVQYIGYTNGVDGLPGNDDGGTMSAWFVWSALGLYPIVGTDRYAPMPPLFPKATVRLEDGATLEVAAPGAARDVGSIESWSLDGAELDPIGLRHEAIAGGGALDYTLAPFE